MVEYISGRKVTIIWRRDDLGRKDKKHTPVWTAISIQAISSVGWPLARIYINTNKAKIIWRIDSYLLCFHIRGRKTEDAVGKHWYYGMGARDISSLSNRVSWNNQRSFQKIRFWINAFAIWISSVYFQHRQLEETMQNCSRRCYRWKLETGDSRCSFRILGVIRIQWKRSATYTISNRELSNDVLI